MTPRAALPLIVLLAALALGGCADRREWRNAEAADTIEAYEAYLAQYPQGDYVPPAQRRLAELKEQRDWRIATERDTAAAYRAFIDAWPKGRWVSEARVRIQNFLLDTMPPPVEDIRPPTEADEAAAAAAAAPPGAVPPAAAPSAAPQGEPPLFDAPAAVSHRIQLGAFASREQAEAEWVRARAAHRDLLGLVPTLSPATAANGSPVWRLQAGVASESRAREICTALQAARQPCLYAPPGR